MYPHMEANWKRVEILHLENKCCFSGGIISNWQNLIVTGFIKKSSAKASTFLLTKLAI